MPLEVLDVDILVAGSQQQSSEREWLDLWLEPAKVLFTRDVFSNDFIDAQWSAFVLLHPVAKVSQQIDICE